MPVRSIKSESDCPQFRVLWIKANQGMRLIFFVDLLHRISQKNVNYRFLQVIDVKLHVHFTECMFS